MKMEEEYVDEEADRCLRTVEEEEAEKVDEEGRRGK